MVFDDHRAAAIFLMGLVLEEGTDFQDPIGDIGADQIGPDGHCRDTGDKPNDQCQPRNMQQPACKNAAVTFQDLRRVAFHEHDLPNGRPQNDPPKERVIDRQKRLAHKAQLAPGLWIHVVTFRIIIGIGQLGILMVIQMRVFEAQIGNEDAKDRKNRRFAEQLTAKWVPMHHFVRQRGMQNNRDGRHHHAQGQPNGARPDRAQRKARVAQDQQRKRRPLDQRTAFTHGDPS